MADLIPSPVLEIRDEEQLAAEAIARTSGGLTTALIDFQIADRQRLRDLVASGTLSAPACPELTNANPSSPHTVILEAQAWMLAFIARRINQLPKRDQIEFARLFQIQLRQAAPATTNLLFAVAPPPNVNVIIPIGTQVSTADGSVVFETTVQTVIPYPTPTASIPAQNVVAGATLQAPDQLNNLVDPIAWVSSVTNLDAIDSGSDDESIEEALQRARDFQQRGLRLVSTADLESATLQDILLGNGIVKGFPFVVAGDFGGAPRPGHTTLVVMTTTGLPLDDPTKALINTLLGQMVGNQFVYVIDPIYVSFNVSASIHLASGQAGTAVLAAIEAAITNFYLPSQANFGRPILREQIIELIQATPGVARIVSTPTGPILAAPLADVTLNPWELPQVGTITITIV